MKKPIKIVCLCFILLCVGISATVVVDIQGLHSGYDTEFLITKGNGSSAVAENLKTDGIINFKIAFRIYAKLTGEHIYQSGIHKLNTGMSYKEILAVLESPGDPAKGTVTIPEGYELSQIIDLLEKDGIINREIFIREAENGTFENEFVSQIPNRQNRLEGYIFPDTYTFAPEDTEHDILQQMLNNFEKKVLPVYESANTDKTLDEIISLASIVEREAANDDERRDIASVFTNRLLKGMKLESCATVQYILKERKAVLSNSDTQIDSPYNTYMYSGLPAGPISSPGLSSVKAALAPSDTNYLYFMASADQSYSVFAETYEQHLENMKNIQAKN